MKKSVNLRRKPRSASAQDLLATFRRLGMSDDEIRAKLLEMKAAQQSAQQLVCTCGSLGQRKGDDWPHAKDCPYPCR